MNNISLRRAVPVAIVHHANQYLITDGYDNREGISRIVDGYVAALRLHAHYRIPLNLHLSGTLIETIAWHCPSFLALVRSLREKGLLELIGGTYAENVMPLFPPSFNLRQLNEHLMLHRIHFDCPPGLVKICWVPERVWNTSRMAPVLTSAKLLNGGFKFVLLDDRLLYPTNGSYLESPRARFDSMGPYDVTQLSENGRRHLPLHAFEPAENYRVYRIAGGNGLRVVPMPAHLRYSIPPSCPDHWQKLEESLKILLRDAGEDTLLVYADDLEKTVGVAGWETGALDRYRSFLNWVAFRKDTMPVLLSKWLVSRPEPEERALEAGAFFELAHGWQAGEDYRRWWEGAPWSRYRRYFAAARDAVCSLQEEKADRRLLCLAWKHLLACSYETAWHDRSNGVRLPAPWARALASHARASLVMAAAARWFDRSEKPPRVEAIDVDGDGQEEVILANEHLYAVLIPSDGARLAYLFTLSAMGGAMVVGNPTDDWNFQEELNRYMDWPPNHPGALADVGAEHNPYLIAELESNSEGGRAELINVQERGLFRGMRKSFFLSHDSRALTICYQAPDAVGSFNIESCLSPDYYRLLRHGRRGLKPYRGECWSGFRNKDVAVWLGLPGDDHISWAKPAREEAGHGLNLRVQASSGHFHLLIGCGEVDKEQCQGILSRGMAALHGTIADQEMRHEHRNSHLEVFKR